MGDFVSCGQSRTEFRAGTIQIKDLPSPDAIVAPEEGDLIIFCSRKLHGITKSNEGERISVSSFMAYCGEDNPLYLWS